jgi:hypothetical protein
MKYRELPDTFVSRSASMPPVHDSAVEMVAFFVARYIPTTSSREDSVLAKMKSPSSCSI